MTREPVVDALPLTRKKGKTFVQFSRAGAQMPCQGTIFVLAVQGVQQ